MASTRRMFAKGPICVAGSSPFPILRAAAPAPNCSTKSSKMPSCTKKRVGETQTCPALRDFPTTETFAVAMGSTSSHTMTGA